MGKFAHARQVHSLLNTIPLTGLVLDCSPRTRLSMKICFVSARICVERRNTLVFHNFGLQYCNNIIPHSITSTLVALVSLYGFMILPLNVSE